MIRSADRRMWWVDVNELSPAWFPALDYQAAKAREKAAGLWYSSASHDLLPALRSAKEMIHMLKQEQMGSRSKVQVVQGAAAYVSLV